MKTSLYYLLQGRDTRDTVTCCNASGEVVNRISGLRIARTTTARKTSMPRCPDSDEDRDNQIPERQDGFRQDNVGNPRNEIDDLHGVQFQCS
jgi:hypothetical protein